MYYCNLCIYRRGHVSSSDFHIGNDHVMADLFEDFICKFSKFFLKCGFEPQHLSRLHSHIFLREHLDSIQRSVLAGAVELNQKPPA